MQHEARMAMEPGFHFRVLVGAVIVDHQVQFYFLIRELVIQTAQEARRNSWWRWRG